MNLLSCLNLGKSCFSARGCAAAVVAAALGCGGTSTPVTAPAGPAVLVDPRSGEVFTASSLTSLPARHPRTGKRTLMPALYCSSCQKWHPAPPAEELQRNPRSRKCPKTGTALTHDGPIPAGAASL